MTRRPHVAAGSPLLPGDPPRLGRVRLTGRVHDDDAGTVYAGELGSGTDLSDAGAVVVVLLGAGAEGDSYARARFRQAVAAIRADDAAAVVDAEDEVDIAPWVALRADSLEGAVGLGGGVLAAVTLAHLPPVGRPSGPQFRPHWFSRAGVGRWRLWPLPWPTSLTSAGRWTFVAAFALVLLIASLALWLAIQVFAHRPPSPVPQPQPGPITQPPPPPTPTPTPTPTPGPGGGSGQPSLPTNTSIPPIV